MRVFTSAIVALTFLCLVPITSAATLELSNYSSDETPADLLDATLDFTVSGSILTLDVSNDTADPAEFDLRAIYFNVLETSNVTGLTLLTQPGDDWLLAMDEKAACFGTFDYGLLGGVGSDDINQVLPGDTGTFTFEIAGSGPFFDTDFTTAYSTNPPGNMSTLAAAKFVEGPGDDSAFGGTVHTPEPTTVALMAMGCVAIVRQRRR